MTMHTEINSHEAILKPDTFSLAVEQKVRAHAVQEQKYTQKLVPLQAMAICLKNLLYLFQLRYFKNLTNQFLLLRQSTTRFAMMSPLRGKNIYSYTTTNHIARGSSGVAQESNSNSSELPQGTVLGTCILANNFQMGLPGGSFGSMDIFVSNRDHLWFNGCILLHSTIKLLLKTTM